VLSALCVGDLGDKEWKMTPEISREEGEDLLRKHLILWFGNTARVLKDAAEYYKVTPSVIGSARSGRGPIPADIAKHMGLRRVSNTPKGRTIIGYERIKG